MGRSRSRSRSRSRERSLRDDRHESSSSRHRRSSRSRSRSRSRDRKWRSDDRDRRREREGRPPRHEEDLGSSRGKERERRREKDEEGSSRRNRDRDRDRDRPPSSSGSRRREREKERAESQSQSQSQRESPTPQEDEDSKKDGVREVVEEDEEPLELDEASLTLMMGVGPTAEEEQQLIEERKRKREEIEALHRRKQEEEGRALAAMEEAAANAGGAAKRARGQDGEREGEARGEEKRKGAAKGESEEESEEEEEAAGPVEVRMHSKLLREEEELTLLPPGAMEGDEAVRNGEREPDEEPEFLLDMFALDESKPAAAVLLGASAAGGAAAKSSAGRDAVADTLEDNWDDPEGYYKTLVGEMIAGRYLVLGSIGRGVFSTVLKCQDKEDDDKPVAIKVIRNNEVMRKAAQRELELLREISAADPDNRKHCVRLLDSFEHRSHVVLVFESLQMNLRETLRKFGKHVGINIAAVRTYAKQLLVALRHIGNLSIVHADIKPDNILVSAGFAQLKLCDFGSAFKESAPDNDPTPYLVSRFYRAPEIILGFEYDRAVDLWSIGCCLYELFTGRVTFPGANNNEMLRLMMEVKGGLPQKLIRRHRAAYERLQLEPLFEADGRFRQQETDPVTKKPQARLVHVPDKPARELQSVLMKAKAASDDRIMVQHLADLLGKIFVLDPAKRISVREALHHPFVSASAAAAALS